MKKFIILLLLVCILTACSDGALRKSSNASSDICADDKSSYDESKKETGMSAVTGSSQSDSNLVSGEDSASEQTTFPKMDTPPYTIVSDTYLYPVASKGNIGFINIRGEWVIPPQYNTGFDFLSGIARVRDFDGQEWLINGFNDKLLRIPEDVVFLSYQEGMILAKDANSESRRFVNWQGEWISNSYDDLSQFSEGLAFAKASNGFYGYLNKEFQWSIPPQFEQVSDFSSGLACVVKDSKYGYIAPTGKWVIFPQFDDASAFACGLARVMKDGKYGYIDLTGDWVTPPKFDSASDFCLGYASVEVDKKWGVINQKGEMIIEPTFGPIVLSEDGVANGVLSAQEYYVKSRGVGTEYSVGLIDLKGNWIMKPMPAYSDIVFRDGVGLVYVRMKATCMGLDYQGNTIIEPKYNLTYRGSGILEYYWDRQYDSWEEEFPGTEFHSMQEMPFERGYMDTKGNIIHSTKNDGV